MASRAASDVASADGKEATSLMFLNEVTRKFDSWEVSVYMAHMEEYSYTWEGQQRKGKFFKCTLVWMPDNTQYCYAEIRKTKGSPADIFEKAVDTYRDGFRFRISKVASLSSATPAVPRPASRCMQTATQQSTMPFT